MGKGKDKKDVGFPVPDKMKKEGLNDDTLDTGILAVVRLQDHADLKRDDKITFVLALLLWLLAQGMQILVAVLLRTTTIQKLNDPLTDQIVQNRTAELAKISVAIGNAVLTPAQHLAVDLCKTNDSHPKTHFMMLWIWYAMISQALLQTVWRYVVLYQVKTSNDGVEAETKVYETANPEITKEGRYVMSISLPCKIFIVLFMLTPNLLSTFYVMFIGSKYIALEGDIGVLLMKALILKVVATIDDQVYKFFASQGLKDYVSASGFLVAKTKTTTMDTVWDVWLSGVTKAVVSLVVAFCYYKFWWLDLINFRQMCHDKVLIDEKYLWWECIGHGIVNNTCGQPLRLDFLS